MRRLSALDVAAVAKCCVAMANALAGNPLDVLHAMARVAEMESDDRDAVHDYLYGYRHQTIYHIPRRNLDGKDGSD
jgi:hypothetical protein